jgi:putative transposase
MPRQARIVVPDCAHHVTQRGIRGASVFHDEEDRIQYRSLLRERATCYGVLIWVYTLMTNHIHTIVVPRSDNALSETFRDTHSEYGRGFNQKYGFSGHLWQGRFFSCVLGESHLWRAVRYVERNPVRAGMVKRAEDYRWSSARAHVHSTPDPMLDSGLPLIGAVGNWSEWLAAEDAPAELKAIRDATAREQPLGDEDFLLRLEAQFGRPMRPQKRGRRVKAAVEEEPDQGKLTYGD